MALPVLRKGSKGEAVTRVQKGLQGLGYDTGPPDGAFGPGTEKAVKAFQADRGLTADGIVGERTWSALEQAFLESREGC